MSRFVAACLEQKEEALQGQRLVGPAAQPAVMPLVDDYQDSQQEGMEWFPSQADPWKLTCEVYFVYWLGMLGGGFLP